MASFIADPNTGIDFTALDFDDLVGNVLVTQSPNTWQTQFGFIGNDYIVYHGVGLTYTGGSPTGGTLNELQRYESGALVYSISGFSIPAATFHAYIVADDVQGFLGQIFSGNDNVTGSNQTDWLYGYNGNDVINGNGGLDVLDGGSGNDSLYGGAATDVILGQAGNDLIDGGTGDDWVDGGAGNDTYYVDSTNDLASESKAGAAGGTDKVYSSAGEYTLFSNIEQLYLSGGADINGKGNSLNNMIVGNSGDNDIDGGAGIDSMIGGDGHDLFIVDNSKDVVTEGAGASSGMDTVHSTAMSYILANNVEQLVLLGDEDINGTGNALDNYIQGNDGANVLNGSGGKDTILALDGNDNINGGLGDDVIVGNGGDDTINVSQGNDRVLYTSFLDGHDVLTSFDGAAAGGQDVLDLDGFFDSADIATANRDGLVSIVDNGATVDVGINFFGGVIVIATLNTTSAVTIGEDVLVGTL
ncbi:MAG: calcium-binding protein [Dongiaceae bacterium]